MIRVDCGDIDSVQKFVREEFQRLLSFDPHPLTKAIIPYGQVKKGKRHEKSSSKTF